MKIYLLIEAPLHSIDSNVAGIFATHKDAEIQLNEFVSKRCGYHSMKPNDYYIEEWELMTYCSECNTPLPFDKVYPNRRSFCRECKNKAINAIIESDWEFSKVVEELKKK